jgi:transposase
MKEKSTGAKRRKYDASFRDEVLRMVMSGRPVTEVAQRLGIGENLIYKWKSRSQQPAAVGKENSPIVAVEDHQALLRRIRELETERDILKKALGIFSRQT